MAKLYIDPPELGPQETYLTADVAADATTSTVENNDGFATDDLVVFGSVGQERTEVVTLTGVTAEETLDHTTGPNFAHYEDEAVSEVDYNQVQIKRATSETGTYSAVTTTDLDFDQKQTVYHDADGDSSSWYKIRYYNSGTSTYSSYSVPIQGLGFTTDSLGGMVESILGELDDPTAESYTIGQIERLINSGTRTLTLALSKLHLPMLTSYSTTSLTSGTQLYDLPSDFIRFKKIGVDFDGDSDYDRATFESETEGLPDTDYSTSNPRIFRRGTQFGIRPSDDITSSGTARYWYDAYPTRMTDDNDTHGLPYGAEDVILPWAIHRILRTRNQDVSRLYYSEYVEARTNWLESVSEGFQDYQPKGLNVRRNSGLYGLENRYF